MVHALEKIARLLKPGGILIDIHPTAEPSAIEVRIGDRLTLAGWLHETGDYSEYEDADEALARVARNGLFAVERQGTFEFITRADTLADLRKHISEEWEDAFIDDITSARIEELMSTAERDKEILLRESARIARLRPNLQDRLARRGESA